MSDELERRRRALEEAFFNKYNEELLAKLRAKEAAEETKRRMAERTGITDPAVIENLLAAGIEPGTLAALALAPLVLLAWSDGKVQDPERGAILRAADEDGIPKGLPGYELLEKWLADRPGDALLDAWSGYVAGLRETLEPAAFAELRSNVMDRTRRIARAAGGFLGLNRMSANEQALLDRIEGILK